MRPAGRVAAAAGERRPGLGGRALGLRAFEYRRAILTTPGTRLDSVVADVDAITASHPDFYVGSFGDASANNAIDGAIADDLKKAGTLSVPITLIILLIAFGAVVAASIPLLIGLTAVLATLGLVAIVSQAFPMDQYVSAVVLLVGLAVGVDYSMFYLKR